MVNPKNSVSLTKIGKGRTVLIADDMGTMRMILSNPCRQLGFKVEMVTNGKDALERILRGEKSSASRIDLFLCDWHMPPGIDGIEVLEELHNKRVLDGELLFFMITAQDSSHEIVRAAESILPAYITKAKFTVTSLEKRITAAMRMQDYRFELEDIIAVDKRNAKETNMTIKYSKSIAYCRRIFKEIQEERILNLRNMQKYRVHFLKKKLVEAKSLVGEFGKEQKRKVSNMLRIAMADLEKPPKMDVPTWPMRKIAELFEDENDLDKALKFSQTILSRINPESAWVHVDVGRIYEKKNENEKAIQFYRKAIQLNPKFQKGRDAIAKLYERLDRKYEALSALEEAVALSPDKPDRQKFKGDIHLSFDSEEEAANAEKCYRKVLKIESKINMNQIDNNVNVGKALLLQTERVGEAKEFLDIAVGLSSRSAFKSTSDSLKKARITRGEFYVKTGDLEQAKKDFDAGMKLSEDDDSKLNNNIASGEISSIYFKNGYEDEAMDLMAQFIQTDPKNPEKQLILKDVLEKNNKGKDVERLIEDAIDNVYKNVQKVNDQCKEYRKDGLFEDALNHYNKIINEHPSDEGLWFNKGRTLFDFALELSKKNENAEYERRIGEAKIHFKKAVELEKNQLIEGAQSRIAEALVALKVDTILKDFFENEIAPLCKAG